MQKIKKIWLASLLVFLAAGCNLFSTPSASGVVKSTNGGSDWLFSNSIKDTKTGSLGSSNISRLAFDPSNREVVYASAFTGGLFKSVDSGASWTNILSKILVYDFAINSADPKTIYASGIYGGQGMVLKSTDQGASWVQIYNESSSNNPVRAVGLNPAVANQLVIGTALGNLIKSSDSGLSWQLIQNFNDQINLVAFRQDGVYVLLKNKGLFKGDISSQNFVEISKGISKIGGNDVVYSNDLVYNQVYVDRLSTNLIYLTTSRGLFKSSDNGNNWALLSLPVPKDKANPRPITVAPNSSNLVFTSVGHVIYKSTDGGNTWQTQNVGTAGYISTILVDPALPQIVYAGVYVTN